MNEKTNHTPSKSAAGTGACSKGPLATQCEAMARELSALGERIAAMRGEALEHAAAADAAEAGDAPIDAAAHEIATRRAKVTLLSKRAGALSDQHETLQANLTRLRDEKDRADLLRANEAYAETVKDLDRHLASLSPLWRRLYSLALVGSAWERRTHAALLALRDIGLNAVPAPHWGDFREERQQVHAEISQSV